MENNAHRFVIVKNTKKYLEKNRVDFFYFVKKEILGLDLVAVGITELSQINGLNAISDLEGLYLDINQFTDFRYHRIS